MPTAKRGALIEQFFEDPDCKVFLSTDAGGVGLNLQAASLVINLDLPWNPAVLEQRIARAHRHGQPHTVQVVNLIAQGTIEERMLDTLAAKRDVFASVFGDEEGPTEITFQDTGQGLLKTLDEMLGTPEEVKPELELEPAAVEEEKPSKVAVPRPRWPASPICWWAASRAACCWYAGAATARRHRARADRRRRLSRPHPRRRRPRPGRAAPRGGAAAERPFRPAPPLPGLHLMEQEGYRALLALTGGLLPEVPETEVYRAPAMPAPRKASETAAQRRAKAASEGFDQADNRLKLASVVLQAAFPRKCCAPCARRWAGR